MMKKEFFCLFIYFFGISCNNNVQIVEKINEKEKIIDYLKVEFNINPHIARFDSFYLKELHTKGTSLEIDSLISSNLSIEKYYPLHLNFIKYNNYYGYKDRTSEDYFTINFIQNTNTGKFYFDYINDEAGVITEEFCSHSKMKIESDESNDFKISSDDFKIYNSVKTSRIFGESDFQRNRRTGLELFLNNEFRFTKPRSGVIDSLFRFYDSHEHHKDSLIKLPNDLFAFLVKQSNIIRSQNNYGMEEEKLVYLKDQVNLLFLKNGLPDYINRFLWVYKNNSVLRVRSLLIKGNSKSGYSYFIDESEMCFY